VYALSVRSVGVSWMCSCVRVYNLSFYAVYVEELDTELLQAYLSLAVKRLTLKKVSE